MDFIDGLNDLFVKDRVIYVCNVRIFYFNFFNWINIIWFSKG